MEPDECDTDCNPGQKARHGDKVRELPRVNMCIIVASRIGTHPKEDSGTRHRHSHVSQQRKRGCDQNAVDRNTPAAEVSIVDGLQLRSSILFCAGEEDFRRLSLRSESIQIAGAGVQKRVR